MLSEAMKEFLCKIFEINERISTIDFGQLMRIKTFRIYKFAEGTSFISSQPLLNENGEIAETSELKSIKDFVEEYSKFQGKSYIQHVLNPARKETEDLKMGELFEIQFKNVKFQGEECTMFKLENVNHILENESKLNAQSHLVEFARDQIYGVKESFKSSDNAMKKFSKANRESQC